MVVRIRAHVDPSLCNLIIKLAYLALQRLLWIRLPSESYSYTSLIPRPCSQLSMSYVYTKRIGEPVDDAMLYS